MSQINFVSEFRAITDTCRRECVPGRARLLWIALFTLANDRARRISDDGDTWECLTTSFRSVIPNWKQTARWKSERCWRRETG